MLLFLLLFLKRSLINHSLACAWFPWSKVLLWWLTFLIDWRHKHLKNTIDLLLFYGEWFNEFLVGDLWKPWKKKQSFYNKHIYIYRSQAFWSFMNFYFEHIKAFFVFKKQSSCLEDSSNSKLNLANQQIK